MSLAMYAAPFNDDLNQINYNNVNPANNSDNLNGKRKPNNKTQKNYPKESSDRVNSVLQSIHNLPSSSADQMADFVPIPPPTSAGVENTKLREYALSGSTVGANSGNNIGASTPARHDEYSTYSNAGAYSASASASANTINNSANTNVSSNTLNNSANGKSDYSRFMPNYNSMYQNSNVHHNSQESREDLLMTKLNYMINLLEQSQDEKTNNVTEEIILYCFLGIFIIFVVDSFVRVGKYVR
jgi:hypothetical protein